MKEEKTKKAISLSIALLDEVLQDLMSEARINAKFKLWRAASEADYAALILSITNNLVDFNPKLDEPNASPSLGATLTRAQDLLKGALSLVSEDPKASYERIKRAVALMRKASAATSL